MKRCELCKRPVEENTRFCPDACADEMFRREAVEIEEKEFWAD